MATALVVRVVMTVVVDSTGGATIAGLTFGTGAVLLALGTGTGAAPGLPAGSGELGRAEGARPPRPAGSGLAGLAEGAGAPGCAAAAGATAAREKMTAVMAARNVSGRSERDDAGGGPGTGYF